MPAIWLPDPRVREVRELARFRLHLVHHKSALKCRIPLDPDQLRPPLRSPIPSGVEGRKLLERLEVPEPWRSNVGASVELIDHPEDQIDQINRKLRAGHADHPYVALLMSVPGIRWVLAFTIAAEIGEIGRFATPRKLTGYTGLCPRVVQSGERDRRGPLTKHGPTYLQLGAAGGDHARASPPRLTASATSAPRSGSPSSAGRRSPGSTSPAGSPTRSGTCFLEVRSSLPEAPLFVWRHRPPFFGHAPASEASNFA